MKYLSWVIAVLGLWEFGDIAAVLVPNFGKIPVYLWNHILIGLMLMIAGVWAALTKKPVTAKRLHRVCAAGGLWLVIASFFLRNPGNPLGLLNDVIVGAVVFLLSLLTAIAAQRRVD